MEHAYINHDVARWARERRGFTVNLLADRIGVTSRQITQWETGPHAPPFGKAQDLARVLDIPFGYLFLSARPQESLVIPDLRTISAETAKRSPEFIDLLNDITVKQDWYSEFATLAAAGELPFVARFSIHSPIDQVVDDIRETIRTDDKRRIAGSWSDYLRLLTQSAEEQGILVMRAGVVRNNPRRPLSVSEFRGFAIVDPIAPLVFINSRDAVAAQVFTLAHELAHIWIGESGVSNVDLGQRAKPKAPVELVEQFCNDVATELLVPAKEFDVAWATLGGASGTKAETLARRFRVSVPVILRRANERTQISDGVFFRLWGEHQDKVRALEQRKEEEEEPSGGNFYNTFFARNSPKLAGAVVSAVRAGEMSTIEAARLLSVRSSTIPKLAERLPS